MSAGMFGEGIGAGDASDEGEGPAASSPARSRPPAWSVAALLANVEDTLAARFGALRVEGELQGVARAGSGHVYFVLKDSEDGSAQLRCAMFRRAAVMLPFQPQDGHQVEVRGRLAVYPQRGELQMVVESMRRLGEGSLYELFLRLKQRLAAEGLFDAARRRPLPEFPRRIAVVTSPDAAALRDVCTALARRAPQVEAIVFPTRVQGAASVPGIVAALAAAAAWPGVDAVLLVRGGGSIEDLWSFNDERVVRAIVASPLPVVVGVGHETDVTLADLAADLRAPTPTAAAELVAPARRDALAALASLEARMASAARRRLDRQAHHHDRLAQALARPSAHLARRQAALERAAWRLQRALAQRVEQRARAFDRLAQRWQGLPVRALLRQAAPLAPLAARLAALDPARVMARGWVWIEDARGHAVVAAAGLQPGDPLVGHWSDGRRDLRVADACAEAAAPAPQAPRAAVRRKARREAAASDSGRDPSIPTMPLFDAEPDPVAPARGAASADATGPSPDNPEKDLP